MGDNIFSFFKNFAEDYSSANSTGFGSERVDRGRDLMISINLSFLESIKGTEKKISFVGLTRCNQCNGKGIKDNAVPTKCLSCKGQGRISYSKGIMTYITTCTKCNGAGKFYNSSDTCSSCKGKKLVEQPKNLDVKVRPGVENNEEIVYTGMGDPSFSVNGTNGDLLVRIRVSPHHLFTRKNFDIHSVVPLNLKTAILGGEIEVETVDGTKKINVAPGTQNLDTKKIFGYGVHKKSKFLSSRGDHVITFSVEIPKNLTEKQKKLINEAFS